MELDTSYIVLTMAQAHDLSFFRIDRRIGYVACGR